MDRSAGGSPSTTTRLPSPVAPSSNVRRTCPKNACAAIGTLLGVPVERRVEGKLKPILWIGAQRIGAAHRRATNSRLVCAGAGATRERGTDHMGTMRFALRLALPVGALLIGLQAAAAQDRMAEARQACTPDAMRLCSEFVPDANRVRACMMSKRS